jgi:hypothetical protein
MSHSKTKRDFMSEQQFNIKAREVDTSPELDSPGDSDESLNEEYLLGLNYMPDEKNEYDSEADEVIYADDNSSAPSEIPDDSKNFRDRIPLSAQVISSEVPSPIKDQDTPSDTH